MKYRLMPYVYAQAKDAGERGLPMVRALFVRVSRRSRVLAGGGRIPASAPTSSSRRLLETAA